MKKNVGRTDSIVRIVVALILAALFFTEVVAGITGIVLLVLAGILLVTAFVGFCGLYPILGVNTCKTKEESS